MWAAVASSSVAVIWHATTTTISEQFSLLNRGLLFCCCCFLLMARINGRENEWKREERSAESLIPGDISLYLCLAICTAFLSQQLIVCVCVQWQKTDEQQQHLYLAIYISDLFYSFFAVCGYEMVPICQRQRRTTFYVLLLLLYTEAQTWSDFLS